MLLLLLGLLAASSALHARDFAESAVNPTGKTETAAVPKRADHRREYLIKAAFIYNFAKFTVWPDEAFAGPGAPLDLCLIGVDEFGPALDRLEGKVLRGHPVRIHRLAAPPVGAYCHLLFVARSEEPRLEKIFAAVAGRPVLTISELPNFAGRGGIISLTEPEERIRFEINLDRAVAVRLKLSSKLLFLADIVSNSEAGAN